MWNKIYNIFSHTVSGLIGALNSSLNLYNSIIDTVYICESCLVHRVGTTLEDKRILVKGHIIESVTFETE